MASRPRRNVPSPISTTASGSNNAVMPAISPAFSRATNNRSKSWGSLALALVVEPFIVILRELLWVARPSLQRPCKTYWELGVEAKRPSWSALLAAELRILRCDDLPAALPHQPSVRPNQASSFGGSVFRSSERTLAAVDNREIVTEKTDLGIKQSAFLSRLGDISRICHFFRFSVALPLRRRSLKIFGQNLFRNSVVVARSLGPLPLRVHHKLSRRVLGWRPLSLLATRRDSYDDSENNQTKQQSFKRQRSPPFTGPVMRGRSA